MRWFFDGPVPPEVERWFCRSSLLSKAPPREDRYVLFPSSLGLNVKLREGRLEIKTLTANLGRRTFTPQAAGKLQIWEKRIGDRAAVAAFEKLESAAPHLWIGVSKERMLRKFVPKGKPLEEVSAGTLPLNGSCVVELTRLAVKGEVYWTACLETSGDPGGETLINAAAVIFADEIPAGYFLLENSRPYVEWLQGLACRSRDTSFGS